MDTTKKLTPLEKEIERLKAEAQANLEQAINKATREANSKEARKTLEKRIKEEKANLENTHNGYIKTFEQEYGVKYFLGTDNLDIDTPAKLSVVEKCQIIEKEMIDGKPKYKLSEDGKSIIGAKGEPIKSIIKFNDSSNNPQTLGVTTYYKYLNPNVTKDELEKLFPKKDIAVDKLKDGTLTDEDKKLLKL